MSAPNVRPAWARLARWVDNEAAAGALREAAPHAIDWWRVVPYVAIHLACLAVFVVGSSATAVGVAIALYVLRMFAITGFYHRGFSHRAFRTSRLTQFVFATLATTAAQRGPLWWVSHHRHHHAHADAAADAHSPRQHGFVWSHTGWFLAANNFATRTDQVRDLARFPELRFLDRFDVLPPLALAIILYGLGAWLDHIAPGFGTSGPQLFVWGFCVSTVVLWHATFCINSLAHRAGRRRYATRDDSRNNAALAVLTLGEGWHNNHHHFPGAARQGFYWWEIDCTYYALKGLAACGIVWDLKVVPEAMLAARRVA
ncbi:MAG: acyl-CoA desaturase [Casimicrobiaceae bacterium]